MLVQAGVRVAKDSQSVKGLTALKLGCLLAGLLYCCTALSPVWLDSFIAASQIEAFYLGHVPYSVISSNRAAGGCANMQFCVGLGCGSGVRTPSGTRNGAEEIHIFSRYRLYPVLLKSPTLACSIRRLSAAGPVGFARRR